METTETTNLTIVSKKEEMDALNAKRTKMVEFLDKKIKEREIELQTKKYVVEGKTKVADELLSFLTNDSQWKFSEALGVIESIKQIEEATKALKTKKTTELLLPSLAIEAVYYFLTKVEGVGLEKAKSYIEILKPVSDSLSRSKQDRTDLDQLARDKASIESAIDSGVDVENEDEILKEIQAEMEFEMSNQTEKN